MDRKSDEKPDRSARPYLAPGEGLPNELGLSAEEINDGLAALAELGRRKADRKADRPVKPLFPPDADVPNPQGLTTAEINEGYESLADGNREWRRLRAEKAARGEPVPPYDPEY